MSGVIKRVNAQELFLAHAIPAAVKELLERKHLYQSVTLQIKEKSELSEMSTALWTTTGKTSSPAIAFRAPDVKLFCNSKKCGRLEAFNLVSSEDVPLRAGGGYESKAGAVQVFLLSYLCQSCKALPETFLIRREGVKLILCGRSPMEFIDIPRDIPRQVQKFYRSALLAYQSGETLAGNFMLRTVIEQWARQVAGEESSREAERLIESYMLSLPDDFKSRFYSMKLLYGKLSEDIHSAIGSAELFEDAIGKIVEHFEARRLHKISVK